jgi:hypothetical protein
VVWIRDAGNGGAGPDSDNPADIPAAGKVAAGGNGSAAPDVGSSAAMELAARTGTGAPGTQPSLGSPEPTAGPTGNGMGGGGGPPRRRTFAGAGPDAAGAFVGGAAGGEAIGGAAAVAGCGVAEPAAFFASAEAEADRRPRPAGEQTMRKRLLKGTERVTGDNVQ